MRRYTFEEGQANFEHIVEVEAQQEPVMIEREDGRGVVVVSLTYFSELRAALHVATAHMPAEDA